MVDHMFRLVRGLCACVLGLAAVAQPTLAANARHGVSPFLIVGPQAIPTAAAGPNYGLFTCQVVGLNPGTTCYDPYQMRHAYGSTRSSQPDTPAKGRTIVIVDAYQSPNIVPQLNYLRQVLRPAGTQRPRQPADPSLGTFTQVAPDGLTPFAPATPT